MTTLAPLVTQSTIRRNLEAHAIRKNTRRKESAAEQVIKALPELIPGESKVDAGIAKAVEPSFNPSIGELVTKPQQVGENLGHQAAKNVISGLGSSLFGNLNIEHGLVRVGKVIGGALLILFALYLIAKAISPQATAQAAALPGKVAKR